MIPSRHSPATVPSDEGKKRLLDMVVPKPGEGNRKWLARAGCTEGVLLLGGTDLADFRIRVAQSHLRADFRPSYWSVIGLWFGGPRFLTVPLGTKDPSAVPVDNGVCECALSDYDDPVRYPNIAVVDFAESVQPLRQAAERIRGQRGIVDLPSLILPWLGFVWGTSGAVNPLLDGKGLPGAAFVEAAFSLMGLDVTPGVASSASCPEAIWNGAKWWRPFYEEVGRQELASGLKVIAPRGKLALRQLSAAVPPLSKRRRTR